MKFSMTCSCGDVMAVDAKSRSEAVRTLKGMMTTATIGKHMKQKHPGQPAPSVNEVHSQIAQMTKAA